MSAPSTFDYSNSEGFANTPSELETKCHFNDKSFDLFKKPPVGFDKKPDQGDLLKLLVIIAYDTNKILKQFHSVGSLKKNKKNKKSQKKK